MHLKFAAKRFCSSTTQLACCCQLDCIDGTLKT
ncbi:hypothetical protein BDA96_05G038500 [Sorghum bicolor]|uniref:Uncharacterized protein n=1 Tax=Sorghum bicolor TaxID=4558 RepID=A0A921QX03_SORBI|nr:hypothetical protein BDA96_05G038500 [Sorghum bicolor]